MGGVNLSPELICLWANERILLWPPLCPARLRVELQDAAAGAAALLLLQAAFLRFHSGLRVCPRPRRHVSVCQPLSVIRRSITTLSLRVSLRLPPLLPPSPSRASSSLLC